MQIDGYMTIVFWLLVISSIAIFILIVYWNILHLFLTRKYDPILFRAPYFNSSELGVYSVWPFSLVKTTGYILLITNAPFAKKRFKGLEQLIVKESLLVKFFCYLWEVWFLVFGGIFTICIILSGIDMILAR